MKTHKLLALLILAYSVMFVACGYSNKTMDIMLCANAECATPFELKVCKKYPINTSCRASKYFIDNVDIAEAFWQDMEKEAVFWDFRREMYEQISKIQLPKKGQKITKNIVVELIDVKVDIKRSKNKLVIECEWNEGKNKLKHTKIYTKTYKGVAIQYIDVNRRATH